jgi:pimeloyl-ACP methyl ester carboxylesterase
VKYSILFIIIFVCQATLTSAQQSKFVETEEVKLHYLEFGKGSETIVLIHGLADSSEVWKSFAPILAKNYRIIALDRRGVGKSEKTKTNYNLKTFAADTKKLLEKLRIEKIHLVGHSFGGNVVATFAATYPEKLKTLTLIEGGFWEKRDKTPEIPKCPEPIETDCLISNEILAESYNYDPAPLFSKIIAPTILILGKPNFSAQPMTKEERLNFEREFGQIADKIKLTAQTDLKKGSFLVIKNAGHWVFNDQPQKTAKAILTFIKDK